ncbi:calcium-dependent protein kinase 2, putative [Entamoeba histolytica HM-3:IMSS]|nr:calcium-dependent protein kinase 2, putative [Entamoeba histolytica HM-3:IMSS]
MVDHPYIIKLYDVFDGNDGKLYIITDLVKGGELFDRISNKTFYPEDKAKIVVKRLISAIGYLHSMNIVHRDLKPENILLKSPDDDTDVRIADFGFSKMITEDAQILLTACGTPVYVAPEVLNAKGYGMEVDMWSIGVITYVLLCGYPPFFASVLGIKYEGGVLIAADTLGSYGSMALFKDLERVIKLGKYTIIAGSGEYSDFIELNETLQKKVNGDECCEGKENGYKPSELYSYAQRILYKHRCDQKPLFVTLIVGGVKKDEIFLGQTDMYGTSFTENYVASGIGAHMAMPLLRKEWKDHMSREEAEHLIERCMKILYLNHCWAGNQYLLGVVDSEGSDIIGPITIDTTGKWDIIA